MIFFRRKKRHEAIIDLRNSKHASLTQEPPSTETSAMMPSDDFLRTLAAASAASTEQPIHTNNPDIAERLERLSRRMNRLMERLDLIEHKISRLEHRIDLKY